MFAFNSRKQIFLEMNKVTVFSFQMLNNNNTIKIANKTFSAKVVPLESKRVGYIVINNPNNVVGDAFTKQIKKSSNCINLINPRIIAPYNGSNKLLNRLVDFIDSKIIVFGIIVIIGIQQQAQVFI